MANPHQLLGHLAAETCCTSLTSSTSGSHHNNSAPAPHSFHTVFSHYYWGVTWGAISINESHNPCFLPIQKKKKRKCYPQLADLSRLLRDLLLLLSRNSCHLSEGYSRSLVGFHASWCEATRKVHDYSTDFILLLYIHISFVIVWLKENIPENTAKGTNVKCYGMATGWK